MPGRIWMPRSAIAREVGNRRLEGNLIGNLGILHAVQGRLAEARAYFEQALAIHREVGNRRIEGIDTGNLGSAYMEEGKPEEARAHFHQAHRHSPRSGQSPRRGRCHL